MTDLVHQCLTVGPGESMHCPGRRPSGKPCGYFHGRPGKGQVGRICVTAEHSDAHHTFTHCPRCNSWLRIELTSDGSNA